MVSSQARTSPRTAQIPPSERPRYSVRFARHNEEILAALSLRFQVFNLELREGLASSQALAFLSSLLESAILTGSPLTAAAIGYDLQGEGSVGTEVAYWGNLVLVPHLINLLSKTSFQARLSFGQARNPQQDRKQEARLLHEEVCLLHRNLFYTRNG